MILCFTENDSWHCKSNPELEFNFVRGEELQESLQCNGIRAVTDKEKEALDFLISEARKPVGYKPTTLVKHKIELTTDVPLWGLQLVSFDSAAASTAAGSSRISLVRSIDLLEQQPTVTSTTTEAEDEIRLAAADQYRRQQQQRRQRAIISDPTVSSTTTAEEDDARYEADRRRRQQDETR
ncbi:hypothetical protein M8J77_000573 [Diaphorina citri]|nr:hypothetical protein M8J77_000573 [Diaphorina citri]